MIVVARIPEVKETGSVVALFGAGLIGSAIFNKLLTEGFSYVQNLPFSWNDDLKRKAQVEEVVVELMRFSPLFSLSVVWAAGKAGFGADCDQLIRETSSFYDVLDLMSRMARATAFARCEFHLVSSAGGLFEGCRFVTPDTSPKPLRAYGRQKLEQELALSRLPYQVHRYVYRLASVYGHTVAGGRYGLINALLSAGIMNREAVISSRSETVRDYVLADDVGKFVVGSLGKKEGIFTLASGKPSSIHEIVSIIERKLNRKLFLRFRIKPENASDMSYSSSSLPYNWQPTDLRTGIWMTAERLIAVHFAGSA